MERVVPGSTRVGGLDIDVVVNPDRRGVRLTVERDARITATIPAGLAISELAAAVKARRRWIYDKLDQRAYEVATRPVKEFVTGEDFQYLGRNYRMKLVDAAPVPVGLIRGRLQLRRDHLNRAEGHLIDWYRARGQVWLPKRAAPWANRMRAPLEELTVRKLGYRWGSCGRGGVVNIHWATMQLRASLVDYVLVHELAHLHHPDHSGEFWRTVGRAMPDFARRRDQLHREGARLWLPELTK
ncbi:M48 family metallopeptidase [Amycolatopsis samaneae]|uniref:M48 family metallopeptidase n=1 Tax=Amycolatopsis samaneae TaxID=664691 RepID=A0ABW5GTB8_9PSEU